MCFNNWNQNQNQNGCCCIGLRGPTGVQGPAGTISVGTVTTGDPNTSAQVTNRGTVNAAIFDFVIPQGQNGTPGTPGATGPTGPTGPAGTISVGTVTTGAPNTPAQVTNRGTANAAILDFVIPQGATGAQGPAGAAFETYLAATNETAATVPQNGPIAFTRVQTANRITYANSTFTTTDAGVYLIHWDLSLRNPNTDGIIGVGIYDLTRNEYVNTSNTGNAVATNDGAHLTGTSLVVATAGNTYQLRNASDQTFTLLPYNESSANITIVRIA